MECQTPGWRVRQSLPSGQQTSRALITVSLRSPPAGMAPGARLTHGKGLEVLKGKGGRRFCGSWQISETPWTVWTPLLFIHSASLKSTPSFEQRLLTLRTLQCPMVLGSMFCATPSPPCHRSLSCCPLSTTPVACAILEASQIYRLALLLTAALHLPCLQLI